MTPLSEAFQNQAVSCTNLGSPFMGRLLNHFATTWSPGPLLERKCATFEGDLGPAGVSLPLRIAGGLHALRLQGDAGLDSIYPPHDPNDHDFARGLSEALQSHDVFLAEWVELPPQTNELRRSVVLIPGAQIVAKQFDLPIHLSELGASGGLNLMWDHFAIETDTWRIGPEDAVVVLRPDWQGPEPAQSTARIASRRGVDLNPLDPTDADDLLRLTAYLWPDQPERLKNTKAAAGAVPAPVDQGSAIDWLEDRLASAPSGHIHLVQNTVAWQYFLKQDQTRGEALFEHYGAKATEEAPLAWLQLETDGDQQALGGGAITLQIWPGGTKQFLGRADFHGRWVKWRG